MLAYFNTYSYKFLKVMPILKYFARNVVFVELDLRTVQIFELLQQGVFGIGGMEWWNEMLEWNAGVKRWSETLEWNTGISDPLPSI